MGRRRSLPDAVRVGDTLNMNAGTWLPTLALVAGLAFWVVSVVDFARTPEGRERVFTRPVWLVLLVLGSVVASAAWWAVGRPQHD